MTTQTIVKERPILFSGAMVRALLAGTKTQTRRIIKESWNGCLTNGGPHPCPVDPLHATAAEWQAQHPKDLYADRWLFECSTMEPVWVKCPYGIPGDKLWVREGFVPLHETHPDGLWRYKADIDYANYPFKPSIHMPRAASRILLEIVSVRVERLQDMSEADAEAEGVEKHPVEGWEPEYDAGLFRNYLYTEKTAATQARAKCSAIESYESLWQSINGPDSWAANPWVWVVEFKIVNS